MVRVHPAKPDQQPEASLAWCSGNQHYEAQTASPKAMLLSLERGFHVGAFVFFLAGAVRQPHYGLRSVVRPGSKNMSRWILGFPRNLGDPVVST